jgi:hypothetical protein
MVFIPGVFAQAPDGNTDSHDLREHHWTVAPLVGLGYLVVARDDGSGHLHHLASAFDLFKGDVKRWRISNVRKEPLYPCI